MLFHMPKACPYNLEKLELGSGASDVVDVAPAHEHFGHFGGMVVEEQAFTRVKSGDGSHILVGEGEIEAVKVLTHALYFHRLGNDDHSALCEPAQSHLGHALAIFGTDGRKHRILKEIIAAFGQRSPCHGARTELLHILHCLGLLVELVCLHLIDGRHHLHIACKVDEMVETILIFVRGKDSKISPNKH